MKSIMKMFGDVPTARQDDWVKMMRATGGLSVISVVKSTIFSVMALITQKSNITILILRTICFFVKNMNKSLADRCIYIYIVKLYLVKL